MSKLEFVSKPAAVSQCEFATVIIKKYGSWRLYLVKITTISEYRRSVNARLHLVCGISDHSHMKHIHMSSKLYRGLWWNDNGSVECCHDFGVTGAADGCRGRGVGSYATFSAAPRANLKIIFCLFVHKVRKTIFSVFLDIRSTDMICEIKLKSNGDDELFWLVVDDVNTD